MKKLIALVLIAMLLLTGCSTSGLPETTTAPIETQPQYDWMAAESPIPVRRSGLRRAGLTAVSAHSRELAKQRSAAEIHAGIQALKKALAYTQSNVSPAAVCGWLTWVLR